MRTSSLFMRQYRRIIPGVIPATPIAILVAGVVLLSDGCKRESVPDSPVDRSLAPQVQASGEEFLIGFVDELDAIADAVGQPGKSSPSRDRPGPFGNAAGGARRIVISSTTTDTTFIYGEITPDGFGAVVTERHQYPKGLLLITVRKTHGKAQGRIVTETRKYISFADLQRDSAQQSTVTDVYALSGDTIVTHLLRNGILETYTFRLPVVTRVVNPRDGSVRITSRFGSGGAVVSEVRDGNGSLIQLRRNSGLADGSILNYTQFADSTWRNVRTVGQADGSVFHEITSGP